MLCTVGSCVHPRLFKTCMDRVGVSLVNSSLPNSTKAVGNRLNIVISKQGIVTMYSVVKNGAKSDSLLSGVCSD